MQNYNSDLENHDHNFWPRNQLAPPPSSGDGAGAIWPPIMNEGMSGGGKGAAARWDANDIHPSNHQRVPLLIQPSFLLHKITTTT